ncbi:tetratricopeptide repeat protein [Ktedonobacter racemifer]|uniref:Transcriptional regulator, XRE family n=1 Tax=Ktedonobacter racemifer DSM 44963 TaxID=485913 RepID=D6TYJ5_KTERA|nr:tetratricopeptide repeat protein [Ktedonobacter racemifer]EFH83275.1 transcriptional regulator, XRE family [Ktedonobacter racemifer DSM 44963]
MKKLAPAGANQRLRAERLRKRWSQQELADRIGVSVITINRWERGVTAPSPYFRLKLCSLFGKSATELGLFPDQQAEQAMSPEPGPPVDHPQLPQQLKYLPYRRNPFFTGREALLERLHTRLQASPTQIYALCGLGGIGKTQTALEYAYRYYSAYQSILWLPAETAEMLARRCQGLARRLGTTTILEEQAPEASLELIRIWLETHESWLLILDNVEQVAVIEPLLPSLFNGHILLTTRAQATGPLAQHIDLKQMSDEESALLLLRRAKYLAVSASLHTIKEQDVHEARAIGKLLGGLPLALDQAGAYIEETGCSLADYLARYQRHRKDLLARRGNNPMEHPLSIAGTISLCIERLEQEQQAAAELLYCCAFLHREGITEELLSLLAPELGTQLTLVLSDPLALDDAIARLRALSLLYRQATTHSLVVHSLVQAILRDALSQEQQDTWLARILRGLNRVFTEESSTEALRLNEQLLPQVLQSLESLKQTHSAPPETTSLLYKAARYLALRGQYSHAESFLHRALELLHQSPQTSTRRQDEANLEANLYNCLGLVYEARGAYQQAEQAYARSLEMLEGTLPAEDPKLSEALENSGRLALEQGQLLQAQHLLQRALTLRQLELGPGHPHLVPLIKLVANLAYEQGQYQRAETLLLHAVELSQQTLGPTHPHTIESVSSLATIYKLLGHYQQAEELYQQTILQLDNDDETARYSTIPSLRGLGLLYGLQGQYDRAIALLKQALAICQQIAGHTHSETAESLRTLGLVYRLQGDLSQAEAFLRRACTVFASSLGANHPEVGTCLNMLGLVYGLQEKYTQALETLQQSNQVFLEVFSDTHPQFAEGLATLGMIYSLQGDAAQAEEHLKRALHIQEKALGDDHPALANTLDSLATLYQEQGERELALPLAQRALALRERVWGADHPEVLASRALLDKL